MKIKKIRILFVLWFCFFNGLIMLIAPVGAIAEVDHGIYAGLLEKYVNKGIVDYKGLKNEETSLDRYLKVLEETDTKKLSRNEQFAFYKWGTLLTNCTNFDAAKFGQLPKWKHPIAMRFQLKINQNHSPVEVPGTFTALKLP